MLEIVMVWIKRLEFERHKNEYFQMCKLSKINTVKFKDSKLYYFKTMQYRVMVCVIIIINN